MALTVRMAAAAPRVMGDAGASGATTPAQAARVALLEGLIALWDRDFDSAARKLDEAEPGLDPRRRLMAALARGRVLVGQGRAGEAEALVRGLRSGPAADAAEVTIELTLFHALRGDFAAATDELQAGARRFPDDSRLQAFLAFIQLITDQPMRAALDESLRLDPDQPLAWYLEGNYRFMVRPDARGAIAAFRRAIGLLPGFAPEDLFSELLSLSGLELELEVIRHDPVEAAPDLGMFDTLTGALRELDPRAKPVPMLMPGATDGRFFARLGIQTYGFLPMPLPAELHFMRLIHSENERVPVEAIEFGTRAIARVLERF